LQQQQVEVGRSQQVDAQQWRHRSSATWKTIDSDGTADGT
jgi:hypothetical protein